MMNCCICQGNSRRMEICPQCAPILWPHRIINHGAKRLSKTLLPVPRAPVPIST